MRSLIFSLLLLCTNALAAPKIDPRIKALLERPGIPNECMLSVIPERATIPKAIGQLVSMISDAKSRKQPLVIYCPNAEVGTRIITFAFTAIRRDALRGMTVVCAVGQKNDSYIRPVVEATGAKLRVEPLP